MYKYALCVLTSDLENRWTEHLTQIIYAMANHRRGLGDWKTGQHVFPTRDVARPPVGSSGMCRSTFFVESPRRTWTGVGLGGKTIISHDVLWQAKWINESDETEKNRTPRLQRVWYYNVAVDTWQGWRRILLLFRNTVTFNAYDTIGRV